MSGRNKIEIFAAVVEPGLLSYSSDGTCVSDVPDGTSLCLRYVDDIFTAVHKDEIDTFHEHLNRQKADILFTREVEEICKIPFLDCLVSQNDNKLQTTIYRIPTHTDRLLD